MKIRWLAFAICASVGIGLFFWGTKFFVPGARSSADAGVTTSALVPLGDLPPSRVVDPPPDPAPAAVLAPENSRFQLVGVIAPGDSNLGAQGAALVAIDGKPAQVFKVGDMLESDWILQAIQARSVSIRPRAGTASILLDLPEPGRVANTDLVAGVPDSRQTVMQPTPSRQLLLERPLAPGIGSLHGSAPNVLLNNPADMAPADASSYDAPRSR